MKDTFFDPNDFYIQSKQQLKVEKKQKDTANTKEFVVGKKVEEKKEQKPVEDVVSPDEKKRVYKPGPFALFY